MTSKEWRKLGRIVDSDLINSNARVLKEYYELLEKTKTVDEHPEWYDSACLCRLCCNYGD